MRSGFGALVVVALLVGCSGGSATPNPSPTQPPLLIDTNKLITWEITPGELVGVQVIQKLQNISDHWIQVAPRDSSYEIKAPNGNVVAANTFRNAYPTYLGPGDTGYLIDEYLEGAVAIANIANLTVSARFRDLTEKPTRLLNTRNLNQRSAEALPGGLYVTGEAENVGTEEVFSGHVGAVFFDATGQILGASTTDILEHVLPGQAVAFETRPSNPLDAATVANFSVYAGPDL
jgi:hypothetical protein